MPKQTRKKNHCLPCIFPALGMLPAQAFPGGGDGYLEDLGNMPAFAVLLVSVLFLLIGVLLRIRQMNASIAREAKALEKSEQRLRLMGDNLPNATLFQLEYTPSGGFAFRYLSQGHDKLLGIEHGRAMQDARLVLDHLHEEDIPLLEEAFRQAKEELAPVDLDIRMLDISGNPRWLRIGAVPRREGDALAWDGLVQDITDRKAAEAALVEESRNFQNLFETIGDLLAVCAADGKLLHTNRAIGTRLGYSREELEGMNLFELFPETLRAEARQVVALSQVEQTAPSNLPLRSKGGETIPAEVRILRGRWKNRSAIFVVVRDLADEQQTKLALRESRRMLQSILDTIPLSVFWRDRDSHYLGCNKAFARECSLSSIDEIIGKTPHELFNAETAEAITGQDDQMIASGQPMLHLLQPHTFPDGRAGWRETSKIPIKNEEGNTVGILCVWRDVTQQKLAEEKLKRTLADMDRFNQLMRGRERRTLELKGEVNTLLRKLGLPEKYRTTMDSPL